MGGCSGCSSSMNEEAAANCMCLLGGSEPAGSHRAQQRGQSPHTAVMWPPGWDHTNSGCVAQREKGKCGAPLTNALVWSFTPFFFFFYTELQFVPSSSRGFTYFQGFAPLSLQTGRKQNSPTHFNFTSHSVYHQSSLPVTEQKSLKTLYCKLFNYRQTEELMEIKTEVCLYDDEAQRAAGGGHFKMQILYIDTVNVMKICLGFGFAKRIKTPIWQNPQKQTPSADESHVTRHEEMISQ